MWDVIVSSLACVGAAAIIFAAVMFYMEVIADWMPWNLRRDLKTLNQKLFQLECEVGYGAQKQERKVRGGMVKKLRKGSDWDNY